MQLTVFTALDAIAEKVGDARTPRDMLAAAAASAAAAAAPGAAAKPAFAAAAPAAAAPPAAGAAATTPAAAAAAAAVGPAPSASCFLGLLLPAEEHKVFGYVTNGNVKFVVVVRDVLLKEDKVITLFRSLHRLYTEAVCNPFAPLEGPITSPSFEIAVYRLVEAANATIQYIGPLLF